jgi:uncharacterized protein YutE (UPF0331/DUF86 family)
MDMEDSPAERILAAWSELESALRGALPVCAVAPPTQPSDLLAALRITGVLGPEEEERIMILRKTRNRVAHGAEEPSLTRAQAYVREVAALTEVLGRSPGEPC